jgi:hypothetical protein
MVYAFDVESNTNELARKYDELKVICFDKLVFFLKQDETEQLTKIIAKIDTKKPIDYNLPHICKITNILQNSLENKHENELYLKNLYDAFDKKDIELKVEKKIEEKEISISENVQLPKENITFWHFNMLDDTQLKAFKDENWLLSLIEYNEDWRTNLLKQVQENDVVFLFRRGGYGYIGAFRAKETKVFTDVEWERLCNEGKYEKNAHYDMYDAFADGATSVANICVEPIAYNYNGVGYLTVRRRTIERMNDMEAVKFLLNKFSGKDLDDNQLAGKGKLDSETSLKLNDNYFSEVANKNL